MNKSILIISAMEVESSQFFLGKKPISIDKVYGLKIQKYNYHEVSIILATVGIGRINAAIYTSVLIDRYNPQKVIFSGIAGAINEKLSVGDVVIASEVVSAEIFEKKIKTQPCRYGVLPDTSFKCQLPVDLSERFVGVKYNIQAGKVLTSDIFPLPHSMLALENKLDIDVIDMESSAVCHVSTMLGVNFIVVRSVSNIFDDNHDTYLTEENVLLAAKNASITALNLLD